MWTCEKPSHSTAKSDHIVGFSFFADLWDQANSRNSLRWSHALVYTSTYAHTRTYNVPNHYFLLIFPCFGIFPDFFNCSAQEMIETKIMMRRKKINLSVLAINGRLEVECKNITFKTSLYERFPKEIEELEEGRKLLDTANFGIFQWEVFVECFIGMPSTTNSQRTTTNFRLLD